MCPSCWKCAIGHLGALIGIWVKFGLPNLLIWVSRYEKLRPCSSGSFEKSMPGGTFCVQKATCSVSAKKLSTTRSSTTRPTNRIGTSSSGMILVASSTSKTKIGRAHVRTQVTNAHLVCRLLIEKTKHIQYK